MVWGLSYLLDIGTLRFYFAAKIESGCLGFKHLLINGIRQLFITDVSRC